jgi:cell division protein FtsB
MRSLIVVLLILFSWLQYRLWYGSGSITEVQYLQQQVVAQQQKLERLTTRNQVLEAEVLDLKHGLEALEERARFELGMIREGEVFYQIVETIAPSNPLPSIPSVAPAKSTIKHKKSKRKP